jgi:hypothetical protein
LEIAAYKTLPRRTPLCVSRDADGVRLGHGLQGPDHSWRRRARTSPGRSPCPAGGPKPVNDTQRFPAQAKFIERDLSINDWIITPKGK